MASYQDELLYEEDPDGYNPLVELLLQGITGTGASIAGGLAGLAGLPYGIDAAANAVRRVQDAMTYQPRSRQAQEIGQAVGELTAPIERGKQWLGDRAMEATGSPLFGTLAYAAPDILEAALGLRAVDALGGQRFEFGDIGGQATGIGRRERGAVGGDSAPDMRAGIESLKREIAKTRKETTHTNELQMIIDELEDGSSIRDAMRYIEPSEDVTWDAVMKAFPPKIKDVPAGSYHYTAGEIDPDEWGGLEGVELDNFVVKDDYRGQGLSRSALIKTINEIQSAYPGQDIYLRANPISDDLSMSELVQLYRSVGFEPSDIFTDMESVIMQFEEFPDYFKNARGAR